MLRRTFLAASAFAAAGAVTSCARRAAKLPLAKLRVSAGNHLSMCPFYMAFESGYFAQAGFDIEVVRDIGQPQSIPLIAGGQLDAGFTGFGPAVINAVIRGARLRLVAAREVMSPSCGAAGVIFGSRKAFPEGIRGMRQLKGARIGINAATPQSSFWLDMLLRREGMRPDDVVVRKMHDSERIAAIRAGGLEAIINSEADAGPALEALGLVRGPGAAGLAPGFQYSFITFGRNLLDADVATGARFLHAYFRGSADFLAGKTPRFLDDFASRNKIDANLLRRACRTTFERDGTIHPDDLRRYMEWMAAHDLCPANVDAATLIDTRFLEAARRMT